MNKKSDLKNIVKFTSLLLYNFIYHAYKFISKPESF
jgi:hypothetical protein